jgi:hypothetical protein
MRKREEERKAKEAEQKRREDAARRLAELRAKDAKERQEREKERERKEREARERKERLETEQLARDLAAKLEHERKERERLEKEAKEAREREERREREAREAEERKRKEAEEREARRKKYAAERDAQRKKEAEEARLREEQKKQKEEEKQKELELQRHKEKEELEKQREKERAEKERAERERAERMEKARIARESLEKERLERERLEKEKAEKEKAEKEKAEREKAEQEAIPSRQGTSYAYSGVGERMSMWPNGKPPAAPRSTTSTASRQPPPSSAASSQRTATPSAAKSNISGVSTETGHRPYDKAKPQHKRSASSIGSESSWAASQTTSRTSPPPSVRSGPYSTKDPDKIVISGVYLFMNQFSKMPASQLISGVGSVTDGLILRITTEGLFIDDDVRSVPQREWDVKAWTLKQVEVWCPPHCFNSPSASSPAPDTKTNPFLHKTAASRTRDRGATKAFTGDEADVYLSEMLRACKTCCRLGLCDRTFRDANIPSSTGQTGEWKSKGLHLLRASVRDQEGKRYLFVIDESEAWKMSVGLQRLRRGSQVRQLAVSGMAAADARGTLEMLGWAD